MRGRVRAERLGEFRALRRNLRGGQRAGIGIARARRRRPRGRVPRGRVPRGVARRRNGRFVRPASRTRAVVPAGTKARRALGFLLRARSRLGSIIPLVVVVVEEEPSLLLREHFPRGLEQGVHARRARALRRELRELRRRDAKAVPRGAVGVKRDDRGRRARRVPGPVQAVHLERRRRARLTVPRRVRLHRDGEASAVGENPNLLLADDGLDRRALVAPIRFVGGVGGGVGRSPGGRADARVRHGAGGLLREQFAEERREGGLAVPRVLARRGFARGARVPAIPQPRRRGLRGARVVAGASGGSRRLLGGGFLLRGRFLFAQQHHAAVVREPRRVRLGEPRLGHVHAQPRHRRFDPRRVRRTRRPRRRGGVAPVEAQRGERVAERVRAGVRVAAGPLPPLGRVRRRAACVRVRVRVRTRIRIRTLSAALVVRRKKRILLRGAVLLLRGAVLPRLAQDGLHDPPLLLAHGQHLRRLRLAPGLHPRDSLLLPLGSSPRVLRSRALRRLRVGEGASVLRGQQPLQREVRGHRGQGDDAHPVLRLLLGRAGRVLPPEDPVFLLLALLVAEHELARPRAGARGGPRRLLGLEQRGLEVRLLLDELAEDDAGELAAHARRRRALAPLRRLPRLVLPRLQRRRLDERGLGGDLRRGGRSMAAAGEIAGRRRTPVAAARGRLLLRQRVRVLLLHVLLQAVLLLEDAVAVRARELPVVLERGEVGRRLGAARPRGDDAALRLGQRLLGGVGGHGERGARASDARRGARRGAAGDEDPRGEGPGTRASPARRAVRPRRRQGFA